MSQAFDVTSGTPAAGANGAVVRVAGDVAAGGASSTATRSSVAQNAADVLLLAANTGRKGATIANDSAVRMRVGRGTTAASASSFSVVLDPNDTYEIPSYFKGELRGIWEQAGGGAARVTEDT